MRSGTLSIALLCLLAVAAAPQAGAQLRYDSEFPPIRYSDRPLQDPMTALMKRVEAGEVTLAFEGERGYLDSLLEALDVDPASQVLVFSKTSLKNRFISAETPRALYFNDEVYVGFSQGTTSLEIAAMDPMLGPVFFSLPNTDPAAEPVLEREFGRCLRCHDSFGNTQGGVPRFMLSTNLVNPAGNIVTHETSEMTDTSTPISRRWGGMFVTGTHGEMEHRGNFIVTPDLDLGNVDLAKTGNLTDLSGLVDLAPYPTDDSDIVALLVLEHQVELQNLITRVNYEARTLIEARGLGGDTSAMLEQIAEPLVRSLVMADEAALTAPVQGTTDFAAGFQQRGRRDGEGRSLRDLNLRTRTFEYPLSYLIYTDAMQALPEQVKAIVYRRVAAELSGQGQGIVKAPAEAGRAALEILRETSEEFTSFAGA